MAFWTRLGGSWLTRECKTETVKKMKLGKFHENKKEGIVGERAGVKENQVHC